MWCPMISMRALSLLALACLNFVLQPLAAEEVVRPKVGLVLGGGGARGAAHIGVLEVLRELRGLGLRTRQRTR